jgi:phage terminase large subunit GpA-like protein
LKENLGNPNQSIHRLGNSLWPPPPVLKISEWADQYRVLSPEASAEPGQWQTDRVPYLREILDTIATEREVIVMASSQVGKTEAILNTIGYFMHQDPAPLMMVQPTIEMAEAISKDRIATMIRDSPALVGLVGDRRARDSGNQILHKIFPGGHLTLSGANSPASLASRPIRVMLFDEIDRFPATAGAEGDPVNLASKRTATFWNRRIVKVSTPTIKGASRIEKDWERSDKRRFFVPCPHCQQEQALVWERVKWEKNRGQIEAWYECEFCEGKIRDGHKSGFLRSGQWRSTAPENRVPGFHISELYSPWRTFEDVVRAYLDAKDDPQLLKVFWNTSLGLPYDDEGGEGLIYRQLMVRCEPYPVLSVPAKAFLLTVGVDVQKNRLAVSVWGWGRDEEAWLIYHCEIYGDPIEGKVWQDLEAILNSSFTHESGGELMISLAAIDTGFQPNSVYNFVRKRSNCYAVRGANAFGKPIVGRPSLQEVTYKGKPLKQGVRLWPIGTDTVKGTIYNRLRLSEAGPGYIHFPAGQDQEYFEQLCAEKVITRFVNGSPRREWVKLRPRNEALDCFVYAYAAATIAGVQRLDWGKLEIALCPLAPEEKPAPEVPPKPKQPWARERKQRQPWVDRKKY